MPRPPTAPETDAGSARPVPLRGEADRFAIAPISIAALARAAARGDSASISALYQHRFDLVFATARRCSGRDEQFTLDVVQETFMRVLRAGNASALARVASDEQVDRWLACVVKSVVLDMLRAESRRIRRERSEARSDSAAPERNADVDRILHLQRELDALSEHDRDLLRWRASGMSFNAISQLLGTTIGSVHGRLRRLAAELSSREVNHD